MKIPNDAKDILNVMRKIEQNEILDKDERLKAKLMMNRGYVKLDQTGPKFSDVKFSLTEKSKKFRRLF